MADRDLPELSRLQVAQLITRGHLLVLHRQSIYRLNNWASKHPGGALAVLHFVGRDAVDELEAYHPESTLKRMPAFLVAKASKGWTNESGWEPLVPPVQLSKGWEKLPEDVWSQVESFKAGLEAIAAQAPPPSDFPILSTQDLEPDAPSIKGLDPKQQHQLQLEYRKLHDFLIQEGFYTATPLSNYRYEVARYLTFFALAMLFYFKATSGCACRLSSKLCSDMKAGHYLLSAFFLGCFKHQLTFFVHDAGHVGVTGSYFWDRILAIGVADFMGGMSVGWWCDVRSVLTNECVG
jgi:delta8-fatty-acid desaturase